MILPPIGPDLPGEIWKPVPGYEELVEVSNHGRLRSTPRKLGGEITAVRGKRAEITRYLCANLPGPVCGYGNPRSRVRDTTWKVPVHRIVALVFLGVPPKEKKYINHKDGNKLNNCVENLEYCTNGENVRHAWATGLTKGNMRKKRLSAEIYDEIRDAYNHGGWTYDRLAVKYNISSAQVRYILHTSKTTSRKKRPLVAKRPGKMR